MLSYSHSEAFPSLRSSYAPEHFTPLCCVADPGQGIRRNSVDQRCAHLNSCTGPTCLVLSACVQVLRRIPSAGFVAESLDHGWSRSSGSGNRSLGRGSEFLFVPFGHSVIVLFQTYKNKVYFLPLETLSFPRSVGCQRLSHHFVNRARGRAAYTPNVPRLHASSFSKKRLWTGCSRGEAPTSACGRAAYGE